MAAAEVTAAEVKEKVEQQPELTKEKCTTDPNFAVVCAFIEQFGPLTGVLCPNIGRLQVCKKKSENFTLFFALNNVILL